jgi:uncharacterized protein YwqG
MTADTQSPNLPALLAAAGLGRLTPALTPLLAGSLRLKTTAADEARLALGATKLGGLPDLPAGTSWPQWNGVPLALVAQLHLDELRDDPVAQALPGAGWLHFFYDARQQAFGDKPADRGAWQVLYTPVSAANHLQRQAAPEGLPAESRFKVAAVEWAPEWTLPQRPNALDPKLAWAPGEQSKYDGLLAQHFSGRSAPRHRLLGHADEIQDDMHLQCQLLAHGVSDDQDPRAAALAAGSVNWRLLLQIDSDASAGLVWGNAGMLYFWIEADALRSRRFENVWMALQSE